MTLSDLFDQSLVGAAHMPALEIEEPTGVIRTLTFGELRARAMATAAALAHRGVSPGDRVAAYLPNGLDFLDLFLGTLRLGAIFTPINIQYREREIAHVLADAAPRLLVAKPDAHGRVPPGVDVVTPDTLGAPTLHQEPSRRPVIVDGDHPALIIYTSGTTGQSKGAVLTHNNVLANTAAILTAWRITDRDRYLAVLPLFHVHGLANGLCGWLASGCRMRLLERFDRQQVLASFRSFHPTLFFGVPTVYSRLLEVDVDEARAIGQRMRLFVSGSAPLPPAVWEAFRARFGHTILERYGMSETLMLISNPYCGERQAGSVGVPLPGVSVRLEGDAGEVREAGSVGQVLVRGSNVFQGYWNNPDATRAAFVDGWFKTGDVAERAPDGSYTLRGRMTDLIISGGYNVYPREIEDVVLELRDVQEVAVIGRADADRGEVPVAYVVATDTFSADDARAHCSRMLAAFKVPRAFVRVEALPRNALGKVQKHLLS